MVQFINNTPLALTAMIEAGRQATGKTVTRSELCHMLCIQHASRPRLYHWRNLCFCEDDWIEVNRPFFNMYPRVVDALIKSPLTIKPSSFPRSIVHDLNSVCVKIPVGHALMRKYDIGWFFVSICKGAHERDTVGKNLLDPDVDKHMLDMWMIAYQLQSGKHAYSWSTPFDMAFEESDADMAASENQFGDFGQSQTELRRVIARLATGVMMLAADPDFIKPVLLKADEGKTTPLEERVARAKKRGVYGFTIGEDIETCPHFRRPHFAVRWTGKGATIPKLVPVKGSVVNKKLMTTVPTGYEST